MLNRKIDGISWFNFNSRVFSNDALNIYLRNELEETVSDFYNHLINKLNNVIKIVNDEEDASYLDFM